MKLVLGNLVAQLSVQIAQQTSDKVGDAANEALGKTKQVLTNVTGLKIFQALAY